jgi:hypothetical protein
MLPMPINVLRSLGGAHAGLKNSTYLKLFLVMYHITNFYQKPAAAGQTPPKEAPIITLTMIKLK